MTTQEVQRQEEGGNHIRYTLFSTRMWFLHKKSKGRLKKVIQSILFSLKRILYNFLSFVSLHPLLLLLPLHPCYYCFMLTQRDDVHYKTVWQSFLSLQGWGHTCHDDHWLQKEGGSDIHSKQRSLEIMLKQHHDPLLLTVTTEQRQKKTTNKTREVVVRGLTLQVNSCQKSW